MAPRKEFPDNKFSASEMRRLGDPAAGMFDPISPDGLPVGQFMFANAGMTVKKAMDYVNAVKEGKIDPSSDEGIRQNLNLALMTLGRGAPTARPGGVQPALPAPRYNVNPATDFRQTVNADYGIKPRVPYDKRPVIDETFTLPEQINNRPVVTTQPTRQQVLNAESPRQDVRLGEAQAGKRNELTWQNLMDEMRADNEGMGMAVRGGELPPVSPLVKLAESKISGKTLTPADVGASPSPFQTRATPGIKQRPMVEPTPEAVLEPVPAPSPMSEQRQRIASQIATEEARRAAERQTMAQRERLAGAINEASMARPTEGGPLLQPSRGGPAIGAMGPIGAGAAVTALGFGSQSAQDERARQEAMNAAMERQHIDDLDVANAARDRAAPQQPFAGTDFFAPSPAPEPFTTTDFFAPSPEQASTAAGARSSTGIGSDAVNAARQIAAARAQAPAGGNPTSSQRAPIDVASGTAKPQSSGFLSGLFANRPASTRELFQRSVDNPDDSGAWMRAERQYAATHPKEGERNFDVTKLDDSGMNRGGSVGGKLDKDAALHKALEIIHHMLRSR